MRVVVCGGGVIGAAVACYLSRRGVGATVMDAAVADGARLRRGCVDLAPPDPARR